MIIEFLACLVLGSGDLHDHRDPPIGPLPWRPELTSTGYEWRSSMVDRSTS
jgi:hypothetical protein